MIDSRTLRYRWDFKDSLNELKEIFAAGETISTETVQKTLKSNYIDYAFFLELINVDGLYNVIRNFYLKKRISYTSFVLVFVASVFFSQIVYLFVPPQEICKHHSAENLLYSF